MILHIVGGDGVDLHAIVQQSLAALPIDLHFGHIFDPVPTLKGVWIQEGSLLRLGFALGTSSWGFLGIATFIWGVQIPFLDAIPSLQFNWALSLKALTSRQLQI